MSGRIQTGKGRATGEYPWERLTDEDLLKVRLCDLRLRMRESPVWPAIGRLYAQLERRGIRFRPHVWLSTEWFSPDGVPGIAVPFFAAHPRLARLERRMMGEVEGGTSRWRLRILRHEAGHAIDTAFGIRRRADCRAVFGAASKPYPGNYSVRPGSRGYVLHLGHWYAQSHPTEDFAETFAVWLQPKARWRRDYAGWPALEKLEYVDMLMDEIAGRAARNRDRSRIAPLAETRRTLGEHYRRRQAFSDPVERRYDAWMKRVFAQRARRPDAVPAARYICENKQQLSLALTRQRGVNAYLAEHTIERIRQRVRQLDLVLPGTRRDSLRPMVRLHERVLSDVLRRNREKYVL
jgi:hypothetical protein